MCKGPVAFWATQPQFTCHHCRWRLNSNVRRVVVEGVLIGLAVELLLLLLLWFGLDSFNDALGLLLGAGAYIAYAAGWAAVKLRTVLAPRHPPVSSNP